MDKHCYFVSFPVEDGCSFNFVIEAADPADAAEHARNELLAKAPHLSDTITTTPIVCAIRGSQPNQ
jgi:hypothetical protein